MNGKESSIPLEQSLSPFKQPLRIDISHLIKKGENVVTFCYPLEEGTTKAGRLFIEVINPDADKFGF